MKQLTALKELAEKVEAGTTEGDDFRILWDRPESYGLSEYYEGPAGLAELALGGSLDAAHSLHKAVLGDRWMSVMWDGGFTTAGDGSDGCILYETTRDMRVEVEISGQPARSRLLAIIKAKIAELEN